MTDVKKLSIIIPHKDSWDSLSALLETIPPHDDFQIVLVDDRSTTPPRGNGLGHPNLLFVNNDRDSIGAGAARNCGLQHATGEWLLFADADDAFTPGAFDAICKHMDFDYDLVFFRPASVNEVDGRPSNRHTAYAALVDDFCQQRSEWIRFRFHPPWSKLIRRELVTRNGIQFDETMVANDLVFSLRAGMHADKIQAVPEVVYCVTNNATKGLSNQRSRDFFDVRFNNHVRYNQILKESGYGKYQMSMLTMHRKALRLGLSKFAESLIKAMIYRQPLLNSGDFAKWGRNWRAVRQETWN